MTARPTHVRLRAYAVGFGDCLLLSVTYGSKLPDGRRERHMLVDCGSASPAHPSLADVAGAVAEHCAGRLDVVVATHPHPEHVNGFADPEAGEILCTLKPSVVIRPWTDDPTSPLPARTVPPTLPAERTEYVRAGDTIALDTELPRVSVHVLGPPGADQMPAIVARGEPWFALDAAGALPPQAEPAADAWADAARVLADPGGVGAAEWLLRALRNHSVGQQLEIADAFAALARNTSVVLLVTVGNRTLLLPGDAQGASWAPVLADAQLARRLAAVDVYKVGGHGCAAATPAGLRRLWARRGPAARPLVSVLSTDDTQPDPTVLADLARRGPVCSTAALAPGVWWLDVEAPTHGRTPFTCSPGPAHPQ
jgi:hypothetical protein